MLFGPGLPSAKGLPAPLPAVADAYRRRSWIPRGGSRRLRVVVHGGPVAVLAALAVEMVLVLAERHCWTRGRLRGKSSVYGVKSLDEGGIVVLGEQCHARTALYALYAGSELMKFEIKVAWVRDERFDVSKVSMLRLIQMKLRCQLHDEALL